MPQILANGQVHKPVSGSSLYERELEDLILQHSGVLFPSYHTVKFKKTVRSEEGASQADLALVHKGYKEWWIVEVERSEHSLASHVLPQLRRLKRASYGDAEASYLCHQEPKLDESRVGTMMKGSSPSALVIANEPVAHWRQDLNHLGVKLGVFQVYRSSRNSHLYSIQGKYPDPPGKIITKCKCNSSLQRLVEVYSPAAAAIQPRESLSILFDGRLTRWGKITTADKVYLHPPRTNPLEPGKEYSIVLTDSEQLRFEG